MAEKWVWISSDDSIENRKVSVFACVEIFWSVLLYWLIWEVFDTHWHLISSLIIAPFLLFRSPESIIQGVEWFNPKSEVRLKSPRGILIASGVSVVVFVICWLWASVSLLGHEAWALFWRSAIIGAGAFAFAGLGAFTFAGANVVAGTDDGVAVAAISVVFIGTPTYVGFIAGLVAVAGVLTGSIIFAYSIGFGFASVKYTAIRKLLYTLLTPYLAIGFWFVTLLLRLFATIKHLPSGVRCFARNWQENMFIVDPSHPPSFLPGAELLSIRRYLGKAARGDIYDKLIALIILPFVYTPALLYRWSIKSTFWFYWPILYVQSGRQKDVVDKSILVNALLKHPIELWRLMMAFLTFGMLGYTTISGNYLLGIQQTSPAMIFPYLLAIDFFSIKPWQWFQLATAVLTLVLWLKAWTVKLHLEAAKEFGKEYSWRPLGFMQSLYRLRNLTTWVYLFIGLVFTVLYWPEIYNYLPDTWVYWLADFYDMGLPIRFGAFQAEVVN